MSFDFDTIIPRRGTGNIKYDRKPDLDPFWVADMDFSSPPCVLEALHQRVDHGIFGYAQAHQGVIDTILQYLESRHDTKVEEKEIVHLGGLVPALSLAGSAFAGAGSSILTTTPVYPPFIGVHHDSSSQLIKVPHIQANGRWEFDWDALEQSVTKNTTLFYLCNPQNPLGRVFSEEEITQLAEFCLRHKIILVSDEIHCDLILEEEKTPHFSAIRLPKELRDNSITLLSPSKTYNIAGLGYAYAVIFNDSLRRQFSAAKGHTQAEINCLAYYSAEAAYKDGEEWRQALLAYLRKNRDFLLSYLSEHASEIGLPQLEATYLCWLDCRKLGFDNPANHFERESKLFLSDGAFFDGAGHVRVNIACPQSRLKECLSKMVSAL